MVPGNTINGPVSCVHLYFCIYNMTISKIKMMMMMTIPQAYSSKGKKYTYFLNSSSQSMIVNCSWVWLVQACYVLLFLRLILCYDQRWLISNSVNKSIKLALSNYSWHVRVCFILTLHHNIIKKKSLSIIFIHSQLVASFKK